MSKLMLLSLLIISSFSLSSYGNTFHGAGQDMEEWGKTMQETF